MSQQDLSIPIHYLLAISIGPVQEFIAASRKTRDLWHGSHLLSYVSGAVARELQKPGEVDLVFPAPNILDCPSANIANKLLIEVHHGDPRQLANTAKCAATRALQHVWDDWQANSRAWQSAQHHSLIDVKRLTRQLGEFLEVNAAWIPFNPDAESKAEDSYMNRREQVESLLAGRKSLRDFAQTTGDDGGLPKSSLDPSLETVFIAENFRALDTNESRRLHRELRLKLNEQLDGVSLVKRLAGNNRLVSLARVAVDPYLRAAQSAGQGGVVDDLREGAKTLNMSTSLVERFDAGDHSGLQHYAAFPYDSQLFYDGNIDVAANRLLKETAREDESDSNDAPGAMTPEENQALAGFFSSLDVLREHVGKGMPTDVAVVVADGDRIGKALSEILSAPAHRVFSEKLVDFAIEAQRIVVEHFGAIIYTGGDDVLAFLPADTAIPCAWRLQEAFQTVMIRALPDPPENGRPTLSVGVAFGHYSEHLQVLLKRGRDAEKDAKKDRNALAVSYHARSGGATRTVRRSWKDEPVNSRWWPLVNGFMNGSVPRGFLYELDRLRLEIQGVLQSDPMWEPSTDFIGAEVIRILERKRVDGGRSAVSTEFRDYVRKRFTIGGATNVQLAQLGALIDEMYVALKLAPTVSLAIDTAQPLWITAAHVDRASVIEDAKRGDE